MATILVTGANRGIGLAIAKAFVNRSDNVIATCRSSSPLLAQTGAEIFESVDVTNDGDIANFSKALGNREIDILINNAGVSLRSAHEEQDWPAMLHQFNVNALGPLRVTRALLGILKPGSKIAIITSFMGSIGQNSWGGQYGYRLSKAAANMAGVNLSHELKPKQIPVVLIHPGYVTTDLTGGQGNLSPDMSAKGVIDRISELTMEGTGRFMHVDGHEIPW